MRINVLSNDPEGMTLALEGKIDAEALRQIDRLIKGSRQNRIVLDLGEVTLLDRVAARFLAGQLRRGCELMNCPLYIKHWILRGAAHEPNR